MSYDPPLQTVTDRQLIASLTSRTCPSCGGKKRARNSLCASCYRGLSPEQQRSLYKRVGCGYREAMEVAFSRLSAYVFIHERDSSLF